MSWGLAISSTKLLVSYLVPHRIRVFREAIFDGNVVSIQQLAEERPRLLRRPIDGDGNTALGLAILLGEVDVVRTLLKLGCNPNLANKFDGNHPLILLAKLRPEENSKTPLLAEILLDAGSNPLYEVQHQADTATRMDATQTPSFCETPLLCTIRYQNEDLLRKLIEHKIDINSPSSETGTSPLMLAAGFGYSNICDMLIDAGAEVNAKDHQGNTPLHWAVQGYGRNASVIQTLLQRGANTLEANRDGFTPVMLAQQTGNDECLKLFQMFGNNEKDLSEHQETNSGQDEQNEQSVFSFT